MSPLSLDDVLGSLSRGATVAETSQGLRLRHAHRRPALADAIRRYEREVRVWKALGLSRRRTSPVFAGWDDSVRLYAHWLLDCLLVSDEPFEIRPGVRVSQPEVFRQSVLDRLMAGPDALSADALRADLADLFGRYADALRLGTVPSPRRRAA